MNREAAQAIADLDFELSKTGELITLARLHDAPDGGQTEFRVERVPAKVLLIQPQDVLGAGSPSRVIISPTRLAERQWPSPPRVDDRLYVGTLTCVIETVTERRMQGEIVRYELGMRS